MGRGWPVPGVVGRSLAWLAGPWHGWPVRGAWLAGPCGAVDPILRRSLSARSRDAHPPAFELNRLRHHRRARWAGAVGPGGGFGAEGPGGGPGRWVRGGGFGAEGPGGGPGRWVRGGGFGAEGPGGGPGRWVRGGGFGAEGPGGGSGAEGPGGGSRAEGPRGSPGGRGGRIVYDISSTAPPRPAGRAGRPANLRRRAVCIGPAPCSGCQARRTVRSTGRRGSAQPARPCNRAMRSRSSKRPCAARREAAGDRSARGRWSSKGDR
ncbi:hypothetical protein GA0070606_3353 [Micromonospora citrea]|uniref:Uncharacterized protein n=1 Tax=Micromonospora citrea TaxID=47855 RepID=A0A1C6V3J2_9ACTN|nr:hypothetical protein GA0070606_3353 [Micromonospora citrea]